MPFSSFRAPRRAVITMGAAAVAAAGVPLSASAATTRADRVTIVDDCATKETRALFQYMLDIQGQGVLFGHEHTLTDGFTFDAFTDQTSDVQATTGDYPAVFGWDTLILNGFQKPGVYGAPSSRTSRP